MNDDNHWVVEYSNRQGVFHIDTLGRSLKANIESYVTCVDTDYILLGICNSSDEASKLAEQLKGAKSAQIKFAAQ